MNIHEFQAKAILKQNGLTIQEGYVANSPQEAVEAAKRLTIETGTEWWVIKAQIHAGGRGQGGGVKLAKSLKEVEEISNNMIGMRLITAQTGPQGKLVKKVLVAQDVFYPGPHKREEYYISILPDRQASKNVIIYSPEGGVDIERIAQNSPELIFKEYIDPRFGLLPFQVRRITYKLKLSGEVAGEMQKFIHALYKAYLSCDALLLEVNPLIKTSDNKILAVDAKVNIDDNALFRHPDIAEMRDLSEEDASEVEASKNMLNFVKLKGNVGCMVNGAGLAMATMDIVKLSGGDPPTSLMWEEGQTKILWKRD